MYRVSDLSKKEGENLSEASLYHSMWREENLGRRSRGGEPASEPCLFKSPASAYEKLCSNVLFRLDDPISEARILKGR